MCDDDGGTRVAGSGLGNGTGEYQTRFWGDSDYWQTGSVRIVAVKLVDAVESRSGV